MYRTVFWRYINHPPLSSSVCVHLRFSCLSQVPHFFSLLFVLVRRTRAGKSYCFISLIIPPGLVYTSKRRQKATCNFLHLMSFLHQPPRVRHIRLLLNLCHHHLALSLHPDCLLLPSRGARLPCSRLPRRVLFFISPNFSRVRTGKSAFLAWMEPLFHFAG